MDPASIAGLLLQVSQLALQSGTALYQFVTDAKNVNGHIEGLRQELLSLAHACDLVHGQLQSLAKHYRFCAEDDAEGASVWSSIENKLASCNTTLRTLERALAGFSHAGSNFVTQGLRQFKLNLKQDEIIAMKGQIQSHTSALQVCLLVMDIKISHLASRKVDRTLRKKLSKLEKMMNELRTLTESQVRPVKDVVLLDCKEQDVPLVPARDEISSIRTDAARLSASYIGTEGPGEPWILLNNGTIPAALINQVGDDLVLQCAQDTLSQGTSLYEESLDGASVGRASDLEDNGSPNEDTRPFSDLLTMLDEAIVVDSSDAPMEKSPIANIQVERNKLATRHIEAPVTPRTRSLLVAEPLHMPPQIEPNFRKMQIHFQRSHSSTSISAHTKWNSRTLPGVFELPSPPPEQRISNIRPQTEEIEATKSTHHLVLAKPGAKKTVNRLHGSQQRSETRKKRAKKGKAIHAAAAGSYDSFCSAGLPGNGDTDGPLHYLTHIQEELQDLLDFGVSPSRLGLLEHLQPDDERLLPSHRVTLTGRLGIGKTYVAAAHVHCLMQCFSNMSILWISYSHLEDDCKAITEMLRMKQPTSPLDPWSWLVKILRCLPRRLNGPWLVIIDGVNVDLGDGSGLQKLFDVGCASEGYLLMTTRHIDTAQTFAKDGEVFHVGALDGEDAANLLAIKSHIRKDFEFDMLARSLDYDPFVIKQVHSFLEETGMTVPEIGIQLDVVLDEQSWVRDGQATLAAQSLSRKRWLGEATPEGPVYSTLVSVMGAVLNPSWMILFDALQERHSEAADLLSLVSAIGRIQVSQALLNTANSAAASNILVDQGFLTPRNDGLLASKLMMIAHRVWLVEQGKMELAYEEAEKMRAR